MGPFIVTLFLTGFGLGFTLAFNPKLILKRTLVFVAIVSKRHKQRLGMFGISAAGMGCAADVRSRLALLTGGYHGAAMRCLGASDVSATQPVGAPTHSRCGVQQL